MKVFPKRRARLHVAKAARDNSALLGHVGFSGAATLALLVPVLFFCFVVGQIWPFYLVAGSELLGAAIGLINFRTSVDGRSEFQTVDIPRTPKAKEPPNLKKAA